MIEAYNTSCFKVCTNFLICSDLSPFSIDFPTHIRSISLGDEVVNKH